MSMVACKIMEVGWPLAQRLVVLEMPIGAVSMVAMVSGQCLMQMARLLTPNIKVEIWHELNSLR